MKFDINLYHKEFHPRFELYKSKNLVMVTIIALGLGIIASIAATLYRLDIAKQIASNQTKIDSLNTQIQESSQLIATKTANPVLTARLDKLTTGLNSKRKLTSELTSLTTMKQKSFSELFVALSQSSLEKLWLTRFSVSTTTLEINGNTSDPEVLAKWIRQLNKTEYFQGQEFSSTAITQADNIWAFSLLDQATPNDDMSQSQAVNDSALSTSTTQANNMESRNGR